MLIDSHDFVFISAVGKVLIIPDEVCCRSEESIITIDPVSGEDTQSAAIQRSCPAQMHVVLLDFSDQIPRRIEDFDLYGDRGAGIGVSCTIMRHHIVVIEAIGKVRIRVGQLSSLPDQHAFAVDIVALESSGS